jgi:putative heme iron utilization protein
MKRTGPALTQQARRRALVLLASCPDGCTEAILAAHNIPAEIVAKLLRKGFATAVADHVGRVWITESGRRELIGWWIGTTINAWAAKTHSERIRFFSLTPTR